MKNLCATSVDAKLKLDTGFVALLSSASRRRSPPLKAKRIAPSIEHAFVQRSSVSQPVLRGFTSGPEGYIFGKFHKKARRRILASREPNREPLADV